MAVSWLLLVAAGAVFVSMVVLVVGCLHCRNKGPLASIRQSHAEDEIIHPCPSDPSPAHPAANQSPYSPSVKPGGGRASCTPSQESIASYVNPPEGNRNADSDAEDPGYIEVLPDDEPAPTNPSRASSRSSDGPAYENVDPRNHGAQTQGTSSPQQSKSEDKSEDESDDGSNASYVNDTEGAFSPETPESSDSEDSQNYVNVGNESPWSRTDCELFSGHPF
ncbi:uncharacterized protein V6R79_012440 [Siganus canaliculatus]